MALVNEQIQQQDPYYSEDPEIGEEPTESAAFNVFEHTEVDASKITASQQPRQDILFFANMSISMPKQMLEKLGAEVQAPVSTQMTRFLQQLWPALQNRKIEFLVF